MAFTLERYTAVCRPLLAQTNCTLQRALRIILSCYALVILECTPWLGLTVVPKVPPRQVLCVYCVPVVFVILS